MDALEGHENQGMLVPINSASAHLYVSLLKFSLAYRSAHPDLVIVSDFSFRSVLQVILSGLTIAHACFFVELS